MAIDASESPLADRSASSFPIVSGRKAARARRAGQDEATPSDRLAIQQLDADIRRFPDEAGADESAAWGLERGRAALANPRVSADANANADVAVDADLDAGDVASVDRDGVDCDGVDLDGVDLDGVPDEIDQSALLADLPDYWKESSRPLVSLAFIVPMLVAYEIGVIALGPSAVRNGAEVWLRQLLDLFGLGQYFLLPVLTCVGLLVWHCVSHTTWAFRPSVLWGMAMESATLALGLLVLAQLQGNWCGLQASVPDCRVSTDGDGLSFFGGLLGYLGAGIYEELMFRLALLPLAAVSLRGCGVSRRPAWFLAIVLVSVVFSLAHYRWDFQLAGMHIQTSGYAFEWYSFSFRCMAGAIFSLLFVVRGFGIAVGTHALYDLFAVLL
jgi:hypothetical protein